MTKKILIVDDEEEIGRTTSEVLEAEGYNVKTAKTVDAAWETLQEWEADLILLDILLPGDVKELVKNIDKQENFKIFYLSAFQKSDAKRRGLLEISEKIQGFIEKPFSISTLLEKIRESIGE